MSISGSLLLNSNFLVNIGPLTFSFSKVRNLSDTLETETVQEGGNNWTIHSLPKPLGSAQKLILERGLLANPEGLKDMTLTTGTPVYAVTIMVMHRGVMRKSYYFEKGLITHWELSDFDALQGQTIYKTIEITHSGLHEVPVP